MFNRGLRAAAVCAGLATLAFAAEMFPRVSGETLAGNVIVLPDAAKGKTTILIVTFSRGAEAQARAWTEQLRSRKSPAEIYQVLELEDVPRLFRGMVKSSVRKGIPREQQDHFILLFDGQDVLKKLVNFQNDGNAYVLLLNANGDVERRESGAVDEKKLEELGKNLRY